MTCCLSGSSLSRHFESREDPGNDTVAFEFKTNLFPRVFSFIKMAVGINAQDSILNADSSGDEVGQ